MLGRVPGVLFVAVHVLLPCFSHGVLIVGGFWFLGRDMVSTS